MSVADQIRGHMIALIERLFDMRVGEIQVEIPPRTELGDLAFPIAFDLAKRVKAQTGQKQNPREIAARLAEGIRGVKGVARVEVAGPGYVNVYLDRANYLLDAATQARPLAPLLGGKIIVEHTAVNPNKAAHIGHIRNAVVGDTRWPKLGIVASV
ncbi:MAG TPA: hypothetical protein VJH03_15390 [Blastocatellia bacterium]|nr:hypothetical protein [Blastocatellia bacterium]